MSKQKENKLLKLSKFLHRYYNLFFIILFIISLLLFSGIYFTHNNNVEKRFDNALKSYEQSLSNIFNNLSMETNNYTNESIVPNTSSSCTRDRISINNNNIMNMSERDSFDELEKSFEIGLDLLKASLSEIMKNSNDVLTFWFAFLSVIMVVFTFAGILINNNVLEQSKIQLKFVEKEAQDSIKSIKEKTKIETKKLIDENNKNIQISNLLNLGSNAINTKDYKLAEIYLSRVIELDNNNSIAYNDRGATKMFLGNLEEAIKDFDRAIELNPYLSEAYNNRGNAENNLGNHYNSIDYLESALKDYNKAIEINPNNSEAYNNRASTKKDLAKFYNNINYLEDAIKDFNKSIELNPNNSGAYYNRGNAKNNLANVCNNINYLEDAIKDFTKAIELNPYLSEAYNSRGNAKNSLDNFYKNINYLKEAIKDFDKAIELNPNNSEAYNNRAVVKVKLEDYKGAIEDYNKAIELNSYLSETYNNRGNAKKDLGILFNNMDYIEESILDYNKAIELNHNYLKAYFNRYEAKSLLLEKINKNSKEYKKTFDDAYNDLDTAYSLADEQLKAMIKNQVIGMAILGNEVAKKFCEDKGWDIELKN